MRKPLPPRASPCSLALCCCLLDNPQGLGFRALIPRRRIRQRLHKKLGSILSKKDFASAMEKPGAQRELRNCDCGLPALEIEAASCDVPPYTNSP